MGGGGGGGGKMVTGKKKSLHSRAENFKKYFGVRGMILAKAKFQGGANSPNAPTPHADSGKKPRKINVGHVRTCIIALQRAHRQLRARRAHSTIHRCSVENQKGAITIDFVQ